MNNEINIKKIYIKIVFTSIIMMYFSIFCDIFATSNNPEELTLYSNANLVMDFESGNVLFEKNGYEKVYPASTTKILTAILVIENLNLDDSVVCSRNAILSTPIGSSIMDAKVEEVLSIRNLLYGLMLPSGNDAANVLAEAVSSNMSSFVELMNKKLAEIGCKDTHFTNAHGFHDDNHYTTPYDMAKLMQYCMQNKTFREFIETKSVEIPATNKSEARKLINTNRLLDPNYKSMYYEYCLGGKTGYTEEARGTFIGYAKKDDKLVIIASYDGSQNLTVNGISHLQARFLDSITLFNYSFDNFKNVELINNNDFKISFIDKTNLKTVDIGLDSSLNALINDSNTKITYTTDIKYNLIGSNIAVGDKVGSITFVADGSSTNFSKTYDLYCKNVSEYVDKKARTEMMYFKICMISLGILLFILIITYISTNQKLKKKKSKYTGNNNYDFINNNFSKKKRKKRKNNELKKIRNIKLD